MIIEIKLLNKKQNYGLRKDHNESKNKKMKT